MFATIETGAASSILFVFIGADMPYAKTHSTSAKANCLMRALSGRSIIIALETVHLPMQALPNLHLLRYSMQPGSKGCLLSQGWMQGLSPAI